MEGVRLFMGKELEDVALFDMDGTLCDYELGLSRAMEKLRSPGEKRFAGHMRDNDPLYIKHRADLIRSSEEWWSGLPNFKLGWDVLGVARALNYRVMILTQGPRRNPTSWSGKKKWIDKNLGEEVDVTITRDKSLVYGKVLVDDYPGYVNGWLKWRKNGLVIMPANDSNKGYEHKQVIRYDGSNLEEVREAMIGAKKR